MPYVAQQYTVEDLPKIDMRQLKASGQLKSGDQVARSVTCKGSTVYFETTKPAYGGIRYWLICPYCSENRRTLYWHKQRWECKKCTGLLYRSQSYSKQGQALWQAEQLEAKLNSDGTKPKWMRWPTYDKICEDIEHYYQQYNELTMQAFYSRVASASSTGRSVGAIVKRSMLE